MEEAKKLELKRIEKFKLIYIYFFPVVFLSFTSLYMLVNGEDPKGFFLTNVLISQTLILIPFILSVCMLAAKLLYKEKDENYEIVSLGIGMMCFFFMVGCNFYQYYKYAEDSISIDLLKVAFGTSILLSCLVSSIIFIKKYFDFAKGKTMNVSQKISNMLVAGAFPLLFSISSYFIY